MPSHTAAKRKQNRAQKAKIKKLLRSTKKASSKKRKKK